MNKLTNYSKMWLFPLLLLIGMAGCGNRDAITSPQSPSTATVSSTNPLNMAINVAFNNKITATFSEAMDSSTITTATFTLMQGSSFVSGTVSYTGTTATFAPASNLTPNTAYIATITTGVRDRFGKQLADNYVWSFTTGAAAVVTPPVVSSTDPANAAIGVPFNQKIAATFSVAMDASTFTTPTFTLKQGTTSISGYVSYSGTTALFAPANNLLPNTTYTATITTNAKDLAGNALASNYVWSFTTGSAAVVTAPVISSTDPANAAIGVPFNQKIAATFSKTMDASTITTATVTLMQGTTFVSGTVSYVGTTVTYIPSSSLTPNTTYTATITTGAKDLAGNALASNYVWNFKTGSAAVITPPLVSFTDPFNAATGVALNQKIAATFSKTMDATTITTATFTLKQGTTPVSGFVSYSGTTALFTPASNLAANTVYTATITTGATDLTDNALAADYIWTFTTGSAAVITPPAVSSTDPLNTATGVALNQKVAALFTKTMDATTITTATFTLKQGTTSISGFVSYSGTTALFTPSGNLAANTVYTATITTGAKDLAGNALTASYVWSFTTGAATIVTPPIVSSTDPANAAINVPFNQKIAATFSKTMDVSTITTATVTLMQGTTFVSGTVSYVGTTVTYIPSSNLAPNTTYTATITTGAKDLSGNALVNNYVWSFTTGSVAVITPPVVSSTDPLTGAISVPLNQKIAATFSKTMDAATITTATFTLKQGTTTVSGLVSYSGTTALFTPASSLAPNTVYTATLSNSVKDLAGNAMVNNYVWSFTTGAAVVITPPVVTSTNPANSALGVALNQNVSALFSKTMDVLTITTATFTLKQGTNVVSGTVGYVGTTATYTPLTNLISNTTYTATITTGAKDLAGNPLANNFVWSFTTVAPDTVTLSSFPAAGGTTNGAGIFNVGATVTVNAVPLSGFKFTNWTENGLNVSTSANYQFVISASRTLVAHFAILVPLAGATTFGGFGGSAGMTNQGIFTVVNGDIGTTAASTLITGFHDAGANVFTETPLNVGTVNGVINCAPPAPGTAAKFTIAQLALAGATASFNYLAGLPGGTDPGAGELGGLVLAPGTYTAAAGTFKITSGDLTLDAQNDSNAVWVFQIAQALTVGKAGQPRSIILVNGAKAKNIYWQVGSAATINGAGGGTMAGTIISYAGVTFSTAGNVTLTTLNGRALSLNASVTLVNTVINVP